MTQLISNMYSWLKRQEKIRNAVSELNNLNDKELSDIGISRCDINRVVREGKI